MTSFDGLQGPLAPLPRPQEGITERGIQGGPERSRGFASELVDALRDVDALNDEAAEKAAALARGEDVPLHELLIAQEKADVSFRLLVEVRNQLIDAWREVTRGPI